MVGTKWVGACGCGCGDGTGGRDAGTGFGVAFLTGGGGTAAFCADAGTAGGCAGAACKGALGRTTGMSFALDEDDCEAALGVAPGDDAATPNDEALDVVASAGDGFAKPLFGRKRLTSGFGLEGAGAVEIGCIGIVMAGFGALALVDCSGGWLAFPEAAGVGGKGGRGGRGAVLLVDGPLSRLDAGFAIPAT